MTDKEALKLALEALEDFADVIKYDNEQDDIGFRACCYVLSYDQHSENCKATKAITAIKQALATPVQEPVATLFGSLPVYDTTPPAAAVQEGRDWSLLEATQESLREHMAEIKRLKEAQPVVPDAMTSADIQEHIEYVTGWNDCRQAMLEMMK
jgi:hypothetical protein